MHILTTHTLGTNEPNTWANSTNRPGGLIKVRVTSNMQDEHIAAKLVALQVPVIISPQMEKIMAQSTAPGTKPIDPRW